MQPFSGGNRFLGDYLTEEVLNRLTDEVRDFVTTMSILDRFTVGLCDLVADASTSAGILRDLERTNLFLVPLGPDGAVVPLPPPLRRRGAQRAGA